MLLLWLVYFTNFLKQFSHKLINLQTCKLGALRRYDFLHRYDLAQVKVFEEVFVGIDFVLMKARAGYGYVLLIYLLK